jgi:polysaccharide export outer membrane protein
MIKNLFLYLCLVFLISSCASKKNYNYLQDLEVGVYDYSTTYSHILQPSDILNIYVSSEDNQGVQVFNLKIGEQYLKANYTIQKDGTIEYPLIGKINLAGLTILQAIDLLKNKIKIYVNNPIINLELTNFKYTILGEVKAPGIYKSENERLTLLEALGSAGDLDVYGKRKNIKLIRENNQKRTVFSIDITNKRFIDSEAYYVKQNDVIIVYPNNPKVQASAFNRNMPLYIAVASTIISVIVLLTR